MADSSKMRHSSTGRGGYAGSVHMLSDTLLVPLWAVGAGAAAVLCFAIAASRTDALGTASSLGRDLLLVLGAVLVGWGVLDSLAHSERQALEARSHELEMRGLVPGSGLACLEGGAGDLVEGGCEKAVFANAEVAATAVAYARAQISLLADGLEFTQRVDDPFATTLEPWRRAAELDRYGLVAHVFATDYGCTAEACPRFGLLRNTSAVKNNLRLGTFQTLWILRLAGGAR